MINLCLTVYIFLPSAVRAWNNVNKEAKLCDSINTFRGFHNKHKLQVPKHFNVRGHRKVKYYTQDYGPAAAHLT